MRDFITIGSSPVSETCAQVGSDDYCRLATKECLAFVHQLRRQFGEEPARAVIASKNFPHDFGTYREVVCYYETDDEESREYALRLESETPEFWDKKAKSELKGEV